MSFEEKQGGSERCRRILRSKEESDDAWAANIQSGLPKRSFTE
jgi:hypothetical protein